MGRPHAKQKLLVTGASGVFGWTLCCVAAETWETFGTVYRHPVKVPGVQTLKIDLTEESSVVDVFRTIQPDAVVHAAAISNPDYCQEHPSESEAVNVTASIIVASQCAELEIPCVFTSTDIVFDGESAPYDEDSPANPISTYGQHKLAAEAAMRLRYPNTTICRLPLMFGVGSPVASGSIMQMLHALERGQKLKLFYDEIRTPVSTATAARGIMLALEEAQGCTLHLGGSERISRLELGRITAEVFRLESALLEPCRQRDVATSAPRPRDVSLRSSLAPKIGYRPQTIREQMQGLHAAMIGAVKI